MSDHSIEEPCVLFVQDACGVNRERAVELLEAGSASVERAVEIHFQAGTKRKHQSPTAAAKSPSRQATLSSFFGSKNGKPATNSSGGGTGLAKAIVGGAETNTNEVKSLTLAQPPKKKKATSPKPVVATDSRLHYGALAIAFAEMVATTKRLVKLDSLKTALIGIVTALGGIGDDTDRTKDGQVLHKALELILGAGNIKLQVSGSAVSKAVITVTGVSSTKLREAYRKTGDLGDAAEQFIRNQRLLVEPQPLTITGVHDVLQVIAQQEGKGSQNQRHQQMVKLLRSCKSHEMKFLVRTLLGNMRLGANVRTVLAALAMAVEEMDASRTGREADTQTAIKTVQDTFDFCPRLDKLSYALLCGGVSLMKETCVMEVGTPINPMLANPAHSFEEVRKLMTLSDGATSRAAVAEWKYDGMRCQAHFDGSTMKLYSRHMLETTDQFPHASKAILEARTETTSSFIIDSEIVGVEESADEPGIFRLLPFQDLSTSRGIDSTIRICVYVFDMMYLNSESLAKKPLWRRQEKLREHFRETNDFFFAQSKSLESYDESVLSSFLETAVKGGAEGLMVKLTGKQASNVDGEAKPPSDSSCDNVSVCPYESGVRSQTWLKVKRDYVAGFADTIDVVPIGAWYGNGRKAQKKFLSPVLLAVYDDEEDVYRSISRCMSFTDAMYDAMRDFYLKGIPYPDGVGIAADENSTTKEEAKEGTLENEHKSMPLIQEEDFEAEDDGKVSIDNVDADTEGDEAFVTNCYPSRPSALVVTNESPPIWFKPMEVFEVSFADLSLSKTHTAAAGLVDAERGVALRFPRFKRRRPDKRIDQATTSSQIAELFAKQTKQGKS
jgi:DNA ligase-1